MAKRFAFLLLLLSGLAAHADDAVSFRGKTITMVVTSAAGGGTDTSGRLIASLIVNHLPGKPVLVVRNFPGAEGMTGMNYFAKQVAPDGLTLTMGSTTQADPLLYRKPQSQYDPTTFPIIGGVGRGGTVLIIRKDAEARLYDKRAAPVIMGALGGVPRSGMQMTAWGIEFLGWNAKWVTGYRGTNDLMLALDRGEIDMTSTANMFQLQKVLAGGRFKILAHSGALQKGQLVARAEFGDAPIFANMVAGRIVTPLAQKAYDYWANMTALDKWLALPPGTPQPFVRVYRDAYAAVGNDPEFTDLGKKISEDFEPMTYEDVELVIGRLGAITPEAIAYIATMLRRQGVATD